MAQREAVCIMSLREQQTKNNHGGSWPWRAHFAGATASASQSSGSRRVAAASFFRIGSGVRDGRHRWRGGSDSLGRH